MAKKQRKHWIHSERRRHARIVKHLQIRLEQERQAARNLTAFVDKDGSVQIYGGEGGLARVVLTAEMIQAAKDRLADSGSR